MSPLKKEASREERPGAGSKRIFQSGELFKNEREIMIVHGESQYRLQITKAGKLILNK